MLYYERMYGREEEEEMRKEEMNEMDDCTGTRSRGDAAAANNAVP